MYESYDDQQFYSVRIEFAKSQEQQEKSCFLCQSVNRKLSAIFASDAVSVKLRKLIYKLLRIKVSYLTETNGFICVDCTERLYSLRWFEHQGKKNDIYLKNFPEEYLIPGENYCRLCLCTTSRLQAIFWECHQTPNNPLCELINECIGVELDYHRDFTSNLCTVCRTQLEMLVTFKRISKQIHEEGISANDKEESTKSIEKSSSSDIGDSLLEVMSCESPDTNKKKRKRNVQNDTHKTESKKRKSECDEYNQDVWPKTARQRIGRILWTEDDERNFVVIKENKGRVRIARDGYSFYFAHMKNNGTSTWYCDYRTLYNCKYQMTVGANGKIATVSKNEKHTHDSEPVRLLQCPFGKGVLTNSDGTEDLFWLFGVKTAGREVERHLVYQNQNYILRTYDLRNDTSIWKCNSSKCRATAQVRGVFKFITPTGVHNHPTITKQEFNDLSKYRRINSKSADVITPFRDQNVVENINKVSSLQKKLCGPEIYTKLAVEDDSREFIAIKVRENIYKIRFLGYDFKYYLKQSEGSTLWKCLWEGICNCKAVIVVSDDVKRAEHYTLVQHNHPIEPAPIFLCELKQYSVRNIANDNKECMQLLSRECTYFRSRTILFDFHVYNLYQILNDETRWMCVRTGTKGQQCSAFVIITGEMESFLQKGEHCHLPLPKEEINKIVKPGNAVDLSALKQHQSTRCRKTNAETSNDVLDMLKQQLLNFPVGRGSIWDMKSNQNHPFYFVMDQSKKNDTPYKFFYQNYRYAFASIDEYGTSQWICCKLLETNTLGGTCTARATIEGIFQRVSIRGIHNHDGIPESTFESLCTMTKAEL